MWIEDAQVWLVQIQDVVSNLELPEDHPMRLEFQAHMDKLRRTLDSSPTWVDYAIHVTYGQATYLAVQSGMAISETAKKIPLPPVMCTLPKTQVVEWMGKVHKDVLGVEFTEGWDTYFQAVLAMEAVLATQGDILDRMGLGAVYALKNAALEMTYDVPPLSKWIYL